MITQAIPREIAKLHPLTGPSAADEANHRIANNLQMLTALLSLEARTLTDPGALAAFDVMIRRIGAVASLHRQLYRTHSASTVDLGAYLGDLTRDLNEAGADLDGVRDILFESAAVEVSTAEATMVGMIVSELVGNARKYAYAPERRGTVRIMLRALPFGGFWLEVSDDGRGFVPGREARGTGFGSQLVAMLTSRLGAAHSWHDNAPGTRFTLHTDRT